MLPNKPHTTYTHKQSNRKYRLTGIEKVESSKEYFRANQPKRIGDKFYTFQEAETRYRWIFGIQYLDTKEYEYWLIDYNDKFIKTIDNEKMHII